MQGEKRSLVAVVLGGSRGIGAAIVKRLADDGVSVIFSYARSRQAAEQVQKDVADAGGVALALHADSASALDVERLIDTAAARFGQVDYLVVNAAVLSHGKIGDVPPDEFDRVVGVNVRGAFIAISRVLRHMPDGGRIVTIGSAGAVKIGVAGAALYGMTKAALAALVRGAAIDLADRQITINNVQPGPCRTDMMAGSEHAAIPLIPLGRLGEPADIAGAVAYLLGPDAAFVTGTSLTVDGGYLA